MANNYKIKMKDIQNKYKFKIFCAGYEYDDTELRNEISQRALISEAGRYVELELNPNTYVLTAKLKDKNNNVISTSTPIDLPLESMIVDCDYDATTKSLIITLQNGNTTTIPLGDLISGLATEEDLEEVDAKVDANIEKISDLENELNQYKTIYNVLPKVKGNGESITLDNTGESILKLDPRGQCKQDSTTGKNLFNGNAVSTTTPANWVVSFGNNVLTIEHKNTYTTGTPTLDLGVLPSGTYVLSGTLEDRITLNRNGSYSTILASGETFSSNGTESISLTFGNTQATTKTYKNVQVELGSTATDYEEYTGSQPSPSPDFPQQIHEVSGDNEIDVEGKNLLDEEYYKNATYGSNVYKYTSLKFKGNRTLYFKTILKSGKTAISGLYLAVSNKNNPNLTGNKSYFLISNGTINPTTSNYLDFTGEEDLYLDYYPTSVTPQDIFDTYNIIVSLENADYEPYNGDTYELDLGTLKMRGIGTYEDYFVRNSGKNLFDKDNANIIACSMSVSNEVYILNQSPNAKSLYIPCKPNKTYTISKVLSKRFWVGTSNEIPSGNTTLVNGTFNNNETSLTITSQNTSNYLVVYYFLNGTDTLTEQAILDSIMINEGSTPLPYEPYGTGLWCKYNAIGEVVLDGTQNLFQGYELTNSWRYHTGELFRATTNYLCMSNYFTNDTLNNINTKDVEAGTIVNYSQYIFRLSKSLATSVATAKDWLSTHNTIVYYPLETPYLSLIESETLQSQLDAIEKALGKDGQTNISQINNDIPFKIYASALEKISNS